MDSPERGEPMRSLLTDVRFGLKLLLRDRTFSVAVLLTLAVCVGANVAIYEVVRTVVLDPLPFDQPDRLVRLYNSYPGAGSDRGSNSSADFFLRRGSVAGLEEIGLYQTSGATVGDAGSPERVTILRVTPSFFATLRVDAAMGRVFLEEEMDEGAESTAVLTHDYWEERLGGAPDVIGGTLRVDGRPVTIVGVLPESFELPASEARFFVPLAFDETERSLANWHSNQYDMLGRLAPGASIEQVTAQVGAINAAAIDDWPVPNGRELLAGTGFHTVVVDARDDLVRDVRQAIVLLWGGAFFVLLIGCTNIANLMLVRSQTRLRELATRMSLGAQRPRLGRQILTEAGIVGVAGALAGTVVGAVALRLLTSVGIEDLPRGAEVAIGPQTIAYAVFVSLAAAVLFGAIPIVHLFRTDLGSVFREEGRTGTAGKGSTLLRSGLVTAQVAVAFLLLVGAGLMFRSFRSALDVDPGFRPEGVLTAHVGLPTSRYSDATDRLVFMDELLRATRAIPAVSAAGISTQIPFGPNNSNSVILPEGYEMRPGESVVSPRASWISPGYLETMGIPLLDGRDFDGNDGAEAPRVMIVDRWVAERFWPGRSPVGERVLVGESVLEEEVADEDLYTVVGVAGDIKYGDLTERDEDYFGAYYLSTAQSTPSFMGVAARGDVPPETLTEGLRAALSEIDPELPLFLVRSMQGRLSDSLSTRRTPAVLLLMFSGIALFLSIVGIYGVLAYAVSQRTREIGVRMALGSDPSGIVRLVVGQGARLALAGLVAGAVAAYLLVRLIESLLFGVAPLDPLVFTTTGVLLAGAALLACVLPARQAARIDSVAALMQDR